MPKLQNASSLPPEILCTIFLELQSKRRLPHQVPIEVRLCHVCSHWRAVAIGFSQLWSKIDVYSGKSIVWLPSYLERSKPCLLDVRIDTYQLEKHSDEDGVALLSPIFNLILDHIQRVQRLFWFTLYEATIEQLRPCFENVAAPALQCLHIIANKHVMPYRRSGTPCTIFCGGTPQLRLVDLEVTWTLPRLETVTTLVFGDMCVPSGGLIDQLLNIFANAPCLVHLCIDGTFRLNQFPETLPNALSMDSLRSLKLLCEANAPVIRFLSVLQAPQLESLWLGCRPHYSLTPFLSDASVQSGGKFPQLRYLTLQGHDFAQPNLFSNAFCSVTHLHILYPRNTKLDLDNMFQPGSTDQVHWPNVHTLVIQTTHDAYSGHSLIPNNLVNQLSSLIVFRRQINKAIGTLLLDRDLLQIVSRNGWVWEGLEMETLGPDNYQEFWWNLYEDETLRM
ncbi:hypothetical protein AX17_004620 [Amanita inopinata Kibby_2008]|nr:hypothetical protein AX17_004620 [Amanita inopinata Kibby_2008]